MTRVGVGCWDGDGEPQGLKPAYKRAIGGMAEAVPFPVLFSSEVTKSKAADRSVRSTFTPLDRAVPTGLGAFLLALTQDFRPFGKLRAGFGLLYAAPPGAWSPFHSPATACAVGCIPSPLRG